MDHTGASQPDGDDPSIVEISERKGWKKQRKAEKKRIGDNWAPIRKIFYDVI